MSDPRLTAEDVSMYAEWLNDERWDGQTAMRFVDSHEAIRADVERLTAERDALQQRILGMEDRLDIVTAEDAMKKIAQGGTLHNADGSQRWCWCSTLQAVGTGSAKCPPCLARDIERLTAENAMLQAERDHAQERMARLDEIKSTWMPEELAALTAENAALKATEEQCGAAVTDVLAERVKQDRKWGEQNHDPFTYLTVLMEEVGELSQAALHARFGGPAADSLRKEAVQTAAVAMAIVECLDRNMWTWRDDVDNNGNLKALKNLPDALPPANGESR